MIQSKPSEKGEIITYLSRMGDVLDDIAEGSELIILLVAVHPIINCDKMNIMLREKNFRVHSHLQIITAQTGHIFYNDPLDLPGFHISDHALESTMWPCALCYSILKILCQLLIIHPPFRSLFSNITFIGWNIKTFPKGFLSDIPVHAKYLGLLPAQHLLLQQAVCYALLQ